MKPGRKAAPPSGLVRYTGLVGLGVLCAVAVYVDYGPRFRELVARLRFQGISLGP